MANKNNLSIKSSVDYVGAMSSTLCALHCLFTPVLFAVQATSASCSDISPFWWKIIDVVFLIVSLLAIIYTAKNTSSKHMPKLLYGSWIVLAIIVLNSLIHLLPIPHAFIYVPAMALIVLHLYNRKYCQCKEDNCCTE